jgi:hypothetical protein
MTGQLKEAVKPQLVISDHSPKADSKKLLNMKNLALAMN